LGGAMNSSVLTATYASISGRRESSLGYIYTGYMQLAVSDGTNMVEKMRITSTGNVLVGTTTTASAVSNAATLVAGKHQSFSGQLSTMTSGVAYTMFTMTADFATYIVTVSGLVSAAAYSETAIVHLNNTSVTVTIIADGSVCAISNSGLNIQYTQSSGVTMADMIWSAVRIL
jgi:hypothetical protein